MHPVEDSHPAELDYRENRVDDMAEGARRERLRIRCALLSWLVGDHPEDAGLIRGRRVVAEIERIAGEAAGAPKLYLCLTDCERPEEIWHHLTDRQREDLQRFVLAERAVDRGEVARQNGAKGGPRPGLFEAVAAGLKSGDDLIPRVDAFEVCARTLWHWTRRGYVCRPRLAHEVNGRRLGCILTAKGVERALHLSS